jgi:hypothetical protein
VVPAFGYRVLSEAEMGFGLNGSRGGQLWLISADASGKPLQFVDHVQFPPSAAGVSTGPWPTPDASFLPLAQNTFGAPNSDRMVGEVVITEVHFQPVDPDGAGTLRVKDFEFIEVFNTTDRAIDLTGWRLAGDVTYDFPDGTTLDAGASAVVVAFDTGNLNRSSVFRFTLGMSGDAALLGGLTDARQLSPRDGVIDDLAGEILLVRPGVATADDPDMPFELVVDQIEYHVGGAWPTSPAGTGDSLTRTQPADYGRLPISWVGASPSPGRVDFVVRRAGDANDDGQFDQTDVLRVLQSGRYLTGEPALWSDGDWNGDSQFDQLDIVTALQEGHFRAGPRDLDALSPVDVALRELNL